jgi:hypothetical protein
MFTDASANAMRADGWEEGETENDAKVCTERQWMSAEYHIESCGLTFESVSAR